MENTNENGNETGQPQTSTDRSQLLDPVLTSSADTNFKPLKTVPAFSIHLLISTAISFTGVLLAAGSPPEKRCQAYFTMLYLRAVFWVLTYLFDHFVKHQHEELRLNGYHDFHRTTAMHKGVPLHVVSLWNTTILAVQALMQHYYGDHFAEHCAEGFLSPISYITTFNILETMVLGCINGSYIVRVRKFNKSGHPPDALTGTICTEGSLGLLQSRNNAAELLEKQADLINFLKDHNLKLNQKLMQLNAQVRTVHLN
ncbi:transmembrane protein 192 [Episyrphus balteatus]|uniref:transmembrane protein 192 n=1 Tax=Episyrphus balteatus TaxID=286459 RepID=UPI002485FA23|nr:transmembrane protein 192 [Episyrphus balteatus]